MSCFSLRLLTHFDCTRASPAHVRRAGRCPLPRVAHRLQGQNLRLGTHSPISTTRVLPLSPAKSWTNERWLTCECWTKLHRGIVFRSCVRSVCPLSLTLSRASMNMVFQQDLKSPPTSYFIKKAAGLPKGSPRPGHQPAGGISIQHVYEIAKIKKADPGMDHVSMKSICSSVMGASSALFEIIRVSQQFVAQNERQIRCS